jgi:cytochrome b561
LIDSTPFRLKAQLAPEPRNVIWENIAMHERERWTRKVLISGVLLLLVFFWVIPISYFSALTNENSLRYYFPWLMDLASKNKILRQIIQSFLPTLGVVIFMAILPMILNGKLQKGQEKQLYLAF